MKKTSTNKRKTPVTTYVRVTDHIYFDGKSYRVRVSKDNNKISKNFPSKTKAIAYKKSLLASA